MVWECSTESMDWFVTARKQEAQADLAIRVLAISRRKKVWKEGQKDRYYTCFMTVEL